MHAVPPAAPPLYTPHLPLYSRGPPNTNPENSAKPNNHLSPEEGLRPPPPFHSCHLTSEERRAQLRCAVPGTPPPAVPRLLHTALRGTRSPLQPSRRPPARRPPNTHPNRTRVRDSHLLVKEPEPEATPLRPGSPATASWLFRACQLNPDSAGRVCSPGPSTPRRQE